MPEAIIAVHHITCHYGIRPVLRDFTLQVARGEILALMGPNGSGKSTLVSLLAGVLAPLKGHIEIESKRRRANVPDELAIRKRVAFLAADPYFPANRTGREWLLAVGRLYGLDDERLFDAADRLLNVFDLSDLADSNIAAYSTGQKKKISVCAALITEAPILLLDEPFSGGLDPSGILALKRILQRRAQSGEVTVVMATPVPELVEELATRIVVMQQGQIIADNTLANLRAQTGLTSLADLYGQLTNPEILNKIDRYFSSTTQKPPD